MAKTIDLNKPLNWDKIPMDAIFALGKEHGFTLSSMDYAILTFCFKYSSYSEAQGQTYFRLNQSFISRQTGWARKTINDSVATLVSHGLIKDVTPQKDKGKVRIYTINDRLLNLAR